DRFMRMSLLLSRRSLVPNDSQVIFEVSGPGMIYVQLISVKSNKSICRITEKSLTQLGFTMLEHKVIFQNLHVARGTTSIASVRDVLPKSVFFVRTIIYQIQNKRIEIQNSKFCTTILF